MPLYVQIGERAYDFEPRPVLRQPAISNMEKAKNPFDDQKGMFDPGPDLRFRSVFRTIKFAQRVMSRTPFIGHVPGVGSRLPDRLFLTLVGAIAPDLRFAAVKKTCDCLAIMHIGWRNID